MATWVRICFVSFVYSTPSSSQGEKYQDIQLQMGTHVERGIMITDLDQSEQEQQEKLPEQVRSSASTQSKRQRKVLQTLTGNFSRRSKSVEVEQRQDLHINKKKHQQERTLNRLVSWQDFQPVQFLDFGLTELDYEPNHKNLLPKTKLILFYICIYLYLYAHKNLYIHI